MLGSFECSLPKLEGSLNTLIKQKQLLYGMYRMFSTALSSFPECVSISLRNAVILKVHAS